LLLERRGFEVSTNELETCDNPNTVIEQNPPSGTDAEEGSTVALTVSLGQSVRVPQTRGLEQSDAIRRVRNADLLPRTRTKASGAVAPDRVISSTPAAGAQVRCESDVTLTVSKGPNLVTLPDLLGDQQAVAESELDQLGLIPNVETRDADEPEGEVIGQDPGPGSRLERNAEVTIIVSTGAGSVVMPDVEGQSEDAAISTLQSRGLSVDVLSVETEERGEDGRVISQAPSPGTRLLAGDTVTIEVGEFVEPAELEPLPEAEPETETP
jgi:serine/threonine-protein kinase